MKKFAIIVVAMIIMMMNSMASADFYTTVDGVDYQVAESFENQYDSYDTLMSISIDLGDEGISSLIFKANADRSDLVVISTGFGTCRYLKAYTADGEQVTNSEIFIKSITDELVAFMKYKW